MTFPVPDGEGPRPETDAARAVVADLRGLLAAGALDLPLPAGGGTAVRWNALTRWGHEDLVLGRLAEGHTDATAILTEAGVPPVPDALYGVWAARSAGTGAMLASGPGGHVLHGTVRFCSGAHGLDRALVAALADDGVRLVDVDLTDPRVRRVEGTWQPLGMAASDSPDVEFLDLPVDGGALVGEPGFYLDRPGFALGGAGVAAVWLGGAWAPVHAVQDALAAREPDPHQLAHLGALETSLRAADAVLAAAAADLDAGRGDPRRIAATCRAAVERAAWDVHDRVPRITGPTPLCRDRAFARRLADLQVYVRQHHAERDLAALGRLALAAAAGRSPDTARGTPADVGRPVTTESEWRHRLGAAGLRPFDRTGLRSVVAVAAHPDDETLGIGGLLYALHAAGTEVSVVVATDGEGAFPHLDEERRTELGRTRRAELTAALREQGLAGVPVTWLGLPDSALADHEHELTERLRPLLAAADGAFFPWPHDPHPDHEAAGRAARTAAPSTTHCWSYPVWMWHWTRPEDPRVPWSRAFVQPLDPEARQRKRAAVATFASQLGPGPDGSAPILPPDVLAHFDRDEVLFREPPAGTAPVARFEDLYAAEPDPWDTVDGAYERRKRAVLLASLPRERYGTAFEPACGIGALTGELAGRCDHVLAYDVVPAAVKVARVATSEYPGVDVRDAELPDPPDGPVDLVVLAETLYYLGDDLLDRTLDMVLDHLRPGGDLVAVHWRHWPAEAPRDATGVHDRLLAEPRLRRLVTHEDEEFLLHVLRRR